MYKHHVGGIFMTVQTERRARRTPLLRRCLAGGLATLISLPALLYICALLLAHEALPYTLMEELVIACVFISAALAAVAACAGGGGKVMQTGLAAGAALASAIVVITLAAPGEGPLNAQTLRHVLAAITGGAFGGALSVRRAKPKSRAKRRR